MALLNDSLLFDLENALCDPGTQRVFRHIIHDSGALHRGMKSEFAQGRADMGMYILDLVKEANRSALLDII